MCIRVPWLIEADRGGTRKVADPLTNRFQKVNCVASPIEGSLRRKGASRGAVLCCENSIPACAVWIGHPLARRLVTALDPRGKFFDGSQVLPTSVSVMNVQAAACRRWSSSVHRTAMHADCNEKIGALIVLAILLQVGQGLLVYSECSLTTQQAMAQNCQGSSSRSPGGSV